MLVDASLVILPVVTALATFVAMQGGRLAVPARTPRRAGTAGSPVTARLRSAIGRLPHRPSSQLADDLPDAVELMVVAAASGCNVRHAVEAAARHHRGPAADVVGAALTEVALGERLGEALEAVLGDLAAADADAVRPLVAVLVDCDRYGTPVAPALQRLSNDLRLHRQRRAEAKARRIPVRLLLPLVLCVLPSFGLLTVAPLFAGMARDSLADHADLPFEGEFHDP